MRAWLRASKLTTRTICPGFRSLLLPTRVCCKDTAGPTFPRTRTSRSRSEANGMHRLLRSSMLLRVGLLVTAPLLAHDMWIEPMTFSPQTGEIVGVKLRVGQDLLGDPLPRTTSLINQFIVEDSEGRKPLVG